MNSPRVRISVQNDADMRHYAFVRNTHLPRDTFRRWPVVTPDSVVVAVCVGGALLVYLMGWAAP